MESAPLLVVLIGPLAAAVPALLLGRWRRASTIAALAAVAALWPALLLIEPGEQFSLSGISFSLTDEVRAALMLLYSGALLLLLLAWFFPQGRAFAPTGVAVLSPLAALLMVEPFQFGALALILAAAISAPAVYDGRPQAAAAAWRYFLLTAAALPLLFLSGWFLSPGQAAAAPALPGLLLAALLLLGVFPFHSWIVAVGREAPPFLLPLLPALTQGAVMVYLVNIVAANNWLQSSLIFQQAARWSAALTLLLAVIQMLRVETTRNALAHLILADAGFSILLLLLPAESVGRTALLLTVGRFLGLALMAVALRGWAGVQPRSRLALYVLGGVTMMGLPLTPGFAARWSLIVASAVPAPGGSLPWLPAWLLIGSALVFVAFLRQALRLPEAPVEQSLPAARVAGTLVIFLVLLTLILGLMPQLLVQFVG